MQEFVILNLKIHCSPFRTFVRLEMHEDAFQPGAQVC
jgi:hypothetical protein